MLQNAGHVRLRDWREAVLVLRVIEDVLASLQARKADVRVHARTIDAVDRLRHKACIQAVLLGNLLQGVLEGGGVVGGRE